MSNISFKPTIAPISETHSVACAALAHMSTIFDAGARSVIAPRDKTFVSRSVVALDYLHSLVELHSQKIEKHLTLDVALGELADSREYWENLAQTNSPLSILEVVDVDAAVRGLIQEIHEKVLAAPVPRNWVKALFGAPK